MKKRLGAFLLAIIMTLSVGVMAPVSAAAGDQGSTTSAFALEATADVKITSTSGATVTISSKNTPESGISLLQFTLADTNNKITVSSTKNIVGTVTKQDDGSYIWKSTSNVVDDKALFSFTVKAADGTLDGTGYGVTLTTTAARYSSSLGTEVINTTPAAVTIPVTVDGVKPALKITTQPKAATIALGKTATLSTAVTSNIGDVTYQWYSCEVGSTTEAPAILTDAGAVDTSKWNAISHAEGADKDTYGKSASVELPGETAGSAYVFCHIAGKDSGMTGYTIDTTPVVVTVGATALTAKNIVFSFKDGEAAVDAASTNTVTYNGKAFTAAIDTTATEKALGTAVVNGSTSYATISADDSTTTATAAGTYDVTVVGSGNLSGTVKTSWTIAPATITVEEAKAKLEVTKDAKITTDNTDLVGIIEDAVADYENNHVEISFVSSSASKILSLNSAKDTATAVGVGESTLKVKVTADNHNTATLSFKVTVKAKDAATVAVTVPDTYKDGVAYKTEGTAWSSIITNPTPTFPNQGTAGTDATITYSVKLGNKTTNYTAEEFASAVVTARGEYTVTINYEDSKWMASTTQKIIVGAATDPVTVNADEDWTVYADNLNEQTFATTIAKMKTAIITAQPDAKSGLALAESTPVVVADDDDAKATVAVNAKKTAITIKLAEGDDAGTTTMVDKDSTTVTVKFTSDNYSAINYVIKVVVSKKNEAGITFENGTLTYTGKALSYEKAKLTDKKLKGKITYTYAVASKDTKDATIAEADKTAKLDTNGKPLNAGIYDVTATYDDGTNAVTKTVKLTVEPKTLTITSATVKKTFDNSKKLNDGDVTKVKISGVVKGETLKEGEDYSITAVDEDAFSDVKVGSKYSVKLQITMGSTDKAKNYTFNTDKPKTVKASIVAYSVELKIGTKEDGKDATTTIGDQIFTGKAVKVSNLYIWTETKLPTATAAEEKNNAANAITLMDTGSGTTTGTDITLVEGTDYTVKYTNNTKVGTATITVSPKTGSNYTFKKSTATFKITKNSLSNETSAADSNKYTTELKEVTITYGTTPKASLLKGTVTLTATKAKIAGKWSWDEDTAKAIAAQDVGVYDPSDKAATKTFSATFTPTNSSYEKITVPVKVTINQATLTISSAKVEDIDYDATRTAGAEITDKVTAVTFKCGKNEVKLTKATDDNTNDYSVTKATIAKTTAGTQKVTFEVALTTDGTVSKNYKLSKTTGTTTVKVGVTTITPTITLTGTGITQDSESKVWSNAENSTTLTYTGKAIKPAIKVTYTPTGKSDAVELATTEYTVTYANNTKAGKATITVTPKSKSNFKFSATCSATFTIAKATPTVTVKDITTTYNGKVPDKSLIKGTAKSGKTTVKGTWSFTTYDSTATPAMTELKADAGSYSNVSVTFTPTDKSNYESATAKISVTINKATVKVSKATLASKNLSTVSDQNTKTADVKVTLSNTSLKQGDSGNYTVTANYSSWTKGTQNVSYTVKLNADTAKNYAFKSGGDSYTGTVKGTLTGTLPAASSSSTTTTTTTTTTTPTTGGTDSTGGTGGT
jgi:hypothetical protein